MQRSAVALVPVKGVAGVQPMVEVHQAVAEDLRHDGRAGNGVVALVAVDDRTARDGERRSGLAVHEHQIRRRVQLRDRFLHRPEGRLQDVAAIDLLGTYDPEAHVRMLENDRIGPGPLETCEPLRIVDPNRKERFPEDDRGRHDGPGPRAASGFIHTGDAPIVGEWERNFRPGVCCRQGFFRRQPQPRVFRQRAGHRR